MAWPWQTMVVAAWLASRLASSAALPDWQVPEAPYRRQLAVEPYAGSPATVVTTVFVPAATEAEEEPLEARLVDAQGQARAHAVAHRQGSRLSLYFDASPDERLHLYFAPVFPADPTLAPPPLRSGLRREIRQYGGEIVNSRDQFERAWQSAVPLGVVFEPQVFSAFNPLGDNQAMLHRYDGFVAIEEPGEYRFCTASTDASFLLVNELEVVAWPGTHGVQAGLDGSQQGTATLAAGRHSFTYLHANTGPVSVAVAAVIPPGQQQHQVISPAWFVPAAYAQVGRLERRDGLAGPDFTWENRHMVRLEGRELYELVCEAAIPAGVADDACQWQFGDGTAAVGRTVAHLVFGRGELPVSLRLAGEPPPPATSQSVWIDVRHGQNENDDARALALLRRAVDQERTNGIAPAGYATIGLGFCALLQEPQAVQFGKRALEQLDRLPETDVFPLFFRLAMEVQAIDEQYDLAEQFFLAVDRRVGDPGQLARARLHYAGLLNHCLDRPQQARELLATLAESDLSDANDRRIRRIYLADCALVLDNHAAAARLYEQVGVAAPVIVDGQLDRKRQFDIDSRYFNLRNLIAQQLFPEAMAEINLLEWYRPLEKMAPAMNLLKARALVGNGQPRRAIICLERALCAEADDAFRPQLRLELAQLSLDQGLLAKAKTQIALIKKEFPASREAVEADRLLSLIDRQIGS